VSVSLRIGPEERSLDVYAMEFLSLRLLALLLAS
jgi:hypothetical protein